MNIILRCICLFAICAAHQYNTTNIGKNDIARKFSQEKQINKQIITYITIIYLPLSSCYCLGCGTEATAGYEFTDHIDGDMILLLSCTLSSYAADYYF